jgi:hypothetical protein
MCQVALERLRLAATQDWFARDRGPIPDDLLHIYIYETEEDAKHKLARAEDAETDALKKYKELSQDIVDKLDAKYQAPPPVGTFSLI